jgi:putative transposase
MYPNATQDAALWDLFEKHRVLSNAAIEERRDAWKRRRITIGKGDQEKQLTEIRAADPEYRALNAQSLQVTLKRVDLAFQGFFRRVKAGQTPGYPRFKSRSRFSGFGFKSYGDGWKLLPGPKDKHGRLRITGIGEVRIRGKARTPGTPKTLDVSRRGDAWYASIVLACAPERKHGTRRRGYDWGVESFLTFDDGEIVENPRWVREAEERLVEIQRLLARKTKGSRSWKKVKRLIAGLHRKIASRRHNFLHQTSARLVAESEVLATEKLAVKNMTASARGSVEEPGKNVKQKAGLNRSILDGAPGALLGMVRYKAEEAGTVLVEVPTRKVKPSQTCPACGRQRKKTLDERVHACPCGCVMPRDRASAQVCLDHVLSLLRGREAAPCRGSPAEPRHETLAIVA